ncbi:MAG TPA: hypothetical protein VF762_19785, partial [Blastocatellia bacterium]
MHFINSIQALKRLVLAIFILSAAAPLGVARAGGPGGQRARKAQATSAAAAPAPRDMLGFTPGDDRK